MKMHVRSRRTVDLPVLKMLLPLCVLLCMTTCCEGSEVTDSGSSETNLIATPFEASTREDSFGQELKDFIGVLSALRERLWEVLFSPTMLAKAMPNMVSFLPNLIGGVLTNILELVIDFSLRFVKWIEPSSETMEVTGRYLRQSFFGRLFQWDVLDDGLRLMRVRRSCRPKAACECGAFVLSRNHHIAGFLKSMRSHLEDASPHWLAMISGLRGEPCERLYSDCSENFIDTRPPQSK